MTLRTSRTFRSTLLQPRNRAAHDVMTRSHTGDMPTPTRLFSSTSAPPRGPRTVPRQNFFAIDVTATPTSDLLSYRRGRTITCPQTGKGTDHMDSIEFQRFHPRESKKMTSLHRRWTSGAPAPAGLNAVDSIGIIATSNHRPIGYVLASPPHGLARAARRAGWSETGMRVDIEDRLDTRRPGGQTGNHRIDQHRSTTRPNAG